MGALPGPQDVASVRCAPEATLALFRRGHWYESLDTTEVSADGRLRIGLAPPIMLTDDARWLHRALSDQPPVGGPDRRREILARAVTAFTHGTVSIGGLGAQTPEDFREVLWAVAGLPSALVERWSAMLRARLDHTVPSTGGLTLVSLPGNTFTCLEGVFEAVLGAEAVWIRPSRREPVSAARFTAALLEAGWPAERLGLYPTRLDALATLVTSSARQIVYGGDSVVARFRDIATMSLRGPGRGCAIVAADTDPERAAAWLCDLIASDTGRFCKNVCTIICLGPAEPVIERLAELLDGITLHPADIRWPVAACPHPAVAAGAAGAITAGLRPGDRVITQRPTVVSVGDVSFLAPTLVRLADPVGHPLVGCELPFPFAVLTHADPVQVEAITDGSLFVYTDDASRDSQI